MTENDLTLSAHPTSASIARKRLVEFLANANVEGEIVETAVLLASELVTNAVLHAGSDIRMVVSVADGVRVEVHDDSDQQVVRRAHDEDATVGRGLALVEMLATDYGSSSHPEGGKVVWFRLGPDGAARAGWSSSKSDVGARIEVELRNLPTTLYDVMREHNEALLREYTLESFSENGRCRFPAEKVATAELIRERWIDAYCNSVSESSPEDKPDHVNAIVRFSADDAPNVGLLREIFDDAERLAADGVLLTRPVLPEIRNLREWLLDQSLNQIEGSPPEQWRYVDYADEPQRAQVVPPGLEWLRESEAAVLAGDYDNVISAVSLSAAELLGWRVEELIGRRIVSIVPPRLRELHVSGFTRQTVTGRSTILEQWVPIGAWHRKGYEVPISIWLESHCDANGNTAYLAWLRISEPDQ